jgi:hypothetical protein
VSGDGWRGARPGWVTASVLALVVMIVWTLVIKYLAPLTWFWAERLAGSERAELPIFWDFWPLAHAAMAWGLWRRTRWAWGFGLAVSLVEVAVVGTKFALWLPAPHLGFWRLLWFVNKVYVLAVFSCLAYVLLGPGRTAFAAHPSNGNGGAG